MNLNSRFLIIGAVSAAAVVAFAQTSTNQSTQSQSQTQQGSGSASASASSSARAGGSAQGGGQLGGGFGGNFGGSQSGNASGGTMIQPNYALILNKSINTPISRELWQQEIAYWQRLAQRGAATLAGNWREWDGGLVLLNLSDDTVARQVADNDPGVKAGVFRYELHGFEVKAVGTGAPNGISTSGPSRSGISTGGSRVNSGGSSSNSGGSSSNSGGSSSNSGGSTTRKGG